MAEHTSTDHPQHADTGPDSAVRCRASGLRLPALGTVEAYWEALRGRVADAPALPRRSDIDPRGIENALSQAFLAERIAPGIARLRVAGHALGEVLGAEPRGLPLSVAIAGAQRQAFAELLERVFAAPALVECAIFSPQGFRRPALIGRLLLLPLRGPDGRIDCALGALAFEGTPGRAPRRFSFEPLRCRQIGAAFERAAEQFNPRPYLRLVTPA